VDRAYQHVRGPGDKRSVQKAPFLTDPPSADIHGDGKASDELAKLVPFAYEPSTGENPFL
jgi:hypothetical protein